MHAIGLEGLLVDGSRVNVHHVAFSPAVVIFVEGLSQPLQEEREAIVVVTAGHEVVPEAAVAAYAGNHRALLVSLVPRLHVAERVLGSPPEQVLASGAPCGLVAAEHDFVAFEVSDDLLGKFETLFNVLGPVDIALLWLELAPAHLETVLEESPHDVWRDAEGRLTVDRLCELDSVSALVGSSLHLVLDKVAGELHPLLKLTALPV